MSCLARENGYVYWYVESNDARSFPVFDITNKTVISHISGIGSSWQHGYIVKDPFSANGAPMFSNNSQGQFTRKGAFCGRLVDNLDLRQQGQGMTVSYQINVNYV